MIRPRDQRKPSAFGRGLPAFLYVNMLTRPHDGLLALYCDRFSLLHFPVVAPAPSGLSLPASYGFGNRPGNGHPEHLSPALRHSSRKPNIFGPCPSSPAGPALRVPGRFHAFASERAMKGRDGRGPHFQGKETIR